MKLRDEQVRLWGLLRETITLLCKNGLRYENKFVIDALIGITTDDCETFLVKLEEEISAADDNDETIAVTESKNTNSNIKLRTTQKRLEKEYQRSTAYEQHRLRDGDFREHLDYNDNAGDRNNASEQNADDVVIVKDEQLENKDDHSQVIGVDSLHGAHDNSLSTWNQSMTTSYQTASHFQPVGTFIVICEYQLF